MSGTESTVAKNCVLFCGCVCLSKGKARWTLVRNLQPTTKDVGGSTFNRMFWDSPDHILKRVCSNCRDSHREIYYKRLTKLNSFDLYSNTDNWRSRDNVLGKDFNLYSTLADAMNDRNRWKYCNYDDPNIGMFRDCGPTGSDTGEWTSKKRGGDNAFFFILTDEGLPSCLNFTLKML